MREIVIPTRKSNGNDTGGIKMPINSQPAPASYYGNANIVNNVKAVQSWNKNQIRHKGYYFNVPIGNSQQPLTMPGDCDMLLGVYVLGTIVFNCKVFLKVNEATIIDGVDMMALSPTATGNNAMGAYYFIINRPVQSGGQIQVSFENLTGGGFTPICFSIAYIGETTK